MESGNNIYLPEVFHATNENKFLEILKQESLIAFGGGVEGRAVYLSTEIELGYGNYVFAFDLAYLQNTSADFFLKYGTEEKVRIWIAHEDNLKVDKTSLAYVVCHKPLHQELKQTYPWLICVDALTNNRIREALDQVSERSLPASWNWASRYKQTTLPTLPEKINWRKSPVALGK